MNRPVAGSDDAARDRRLREQADKLSRDYLADQARHRSRTVADLADAWIAEAARYRRYAEESSIPGELRSIARTLEQCAAEVRRACGNTGPDTRP